jgi:hypothetical protein
MTIDIATIAISVGSYALLMAMGGAKYYLAKRISKISELGIVIGHNSGKSSLISSIKANLGENLPVFFIDIEQLVYDDTLITDAQKAELDKLLKSDSVLYHAKMMQYTKLVYENYKREIVKTSPKFKLVVIASTKDIIANLNIRQYYSFVPSSKLQKVISDAESTVLNYLKYTNSMININSRSTFQYTDFDDLYTRVCRVLNLVGKNGQALVAMAQSL